MLRRDSSLEIQHEHSRAVKIRILQGRKGQLFGWMFTYSGQFENCPKLEKAIKQSGSDTPELKTNSIGLTAEMDLTGVELKYPFPRCKKKAH